MSRWLDLPPGMLPAGRAEPLLVSESHLGDVHEWVTQADASWVVIDLSAATDTASVIDALKGVLPFPDWCASSWDSLDDAFEELRQEWRFPLFVVVRGLRSTLTAKPHLGLEVVVRLSELRRALSIAGDQLTVLYAADHWD
ncbi:MAG: barstar family protein [Cryobacterium sp.]|nr:barstar family protein [Cryobacterium sp.]